MNLSQLKYFYTVCVHGSLSDAAEYLYISQPSLSAAIKALEKEFGVSLFTRRHQGMELTKEGKILFEMCKDILVRTDQLENIMKDLGNERSRLRLGVPPMSETQTRDLFAETIKQDQATAELEKMLSVPDIVYTTETGETIAIEAITENYNELRTEMKVSYCQIINAELKTVRV